VVAVVAFAALGWFVYARLTARSFDWALLAGTLRQLRWQWLAAALLPIFGSYYGRALRWVVFLRPLKPHPSVVGVLGATLIGFAAITLFGRPGEFVRPYLIARKEQVPVASQLAAWVLERMFDLLMALAVFGFALTRIDAASVHVGPNLAWILAMGGRIVGVLSAGVLVMLVAMRHFAEPLRSLLLRCLRFLPQRQFRKTEQLLTTFVQGVESTRSHGALFLILLYSIVEWILIAGCFWCLARAYVGVINLTFVDILIFMGFVSFGSTVQIPGIGGGAQVVAVLVLTELFGVKLELATSFAIFSWIMSFVVVVPVGLFWALREGLNWRKLRQLGEEASQ
jgi:glycosyltransferase 2 family protein